MQELEYAVVDVFAERALEGNALAVFADGRGLSDAEMQALARETNLSETTFVLPEEDESDGVRVRIFTTQEELPFAGHPTLGTASWLYWHHATLRGAGEIKLKLNAGTVPVRFKPGPGPGVVGTMTQPEAMFGATFDHAEVAGVLGVPVEALDARLPVQVVSTGTAFLMVPFVSVAALRELAIPQATADVWMKARGARWAFCIAPVLEGADAGRGADFHNRMQFNGGEDPATGSASGCAIAYLVKHGVRASGQQTVFEQGVEMGRPSRLTVAATLAGGRVREVFVGGRTIAVASGRFFLRRGQDIHKGLLRNCNVCGGLEKTVDEQGAKRCGFALFSPVDELGSPPYCWEAMKSCSEPPATPEFNKNPSKPEEFVILPTI